MKYSPSWLSASHACTLYKTRSCNTAIRKEEEKPRHRLMTVHIQIGAGGGEDGRSLSLFDKRNVRNSVLGCII